MSPNRDAYEIVTNKIIEALEAGHIPWHKPWRSVNGELPTSLQTGRAYRGINVWILSVEAMLKGYQSPYWVTFKQAKERGGSVRKGEHGTTVVLWKPVKKSAENDNGETEDRSFLLMRTFTVFNVEQTDGVEIPEHVEVEAVYADPIEACEAVVTGYLDGPTIQHGGNQACYMPALDYVRMPKIGQFDSSELYYSTLFHELAHSTGHESRLKRETLIAPQPFGSPDYSKEELVAQFAAAFLTSQVGIEVAIEHDAAYIQHWVKVLKGDRKMLVSAAAQAQKASDRILGIEPVKVAEKAEVAA